MTASVLPLSGTRVVDLSGPIGAYCTRLLAGFGADVIKVEPPGGDPLRAQPPFKQGVVHPEGSLAFAYYHANKRGVTLDLADEQSAPALRRLVHSADVVVISPEADATGSDAHWREWVTAQTIVCSITPYGLTGPYRGYRATHLTSHAMGGLMLGQGPVAGPPVVIPGQQMYDEAGTHAALAVLVALRNRPAVGGQLVEVSAHEVMASHNHLIQRYAMSGVVEKRLGGAIAPPSGTWHVRDGLVEFQVWAPQHWAGFVELIGRPLELSDERYADRVYRGSQTERLRSVIGPILARESKATLPDRAQALRIPCAPVNTPGDFAHDAQPRSRGFFVQAGHPYLGDYEMPGAPFVSTEPIWSQSRTAPLLGEHNRDILVDELGLVEDWLARDAEAVHV